MNIKDVLQIGGLYLGTAIVTTLATIKVIKNSRG